MFLFFVERGPETEHGIKTFYGTQGTIQSPGYPHKYQYFNQDYFYKILVEEGKTIAVSFETLLNLCTFSTLSRVHLNMLLIFNFDSSAL